MQLPAHLRGISSLALYSVGKMPLTKLLLAFLIKKKRGRVKAIQVHPMLAQRKEARLYYTLLVQSRNYVLSVVRRLGRD